MKRVLSIIVLSFFSVCSVLADGRFSSETEARRYFSQNISNLDPIEGLYDVNNTVVASVPGYGSQRIVQDFTWAISYVMDSEGSKIFNIQGLTGSITGNLGMIERIGETQYYKLYRGDANGKPKEHRFELDDLFSFGYSYIEKYRTASSNVSLTAVKKYPTKSMYQDMIRQSAEEASKPTTWTGTGFALKDGYVVTNYHVIDNAKRITIKGINGVFSSSYTASVVASDQHNDLAVLKITDTRFSGYSSIPYAIKTATVDVGEDIFVLGYPLTATMGDEIKYTTGVISSKTGFQGDVSSYQISAPIQPGNSGGPLFDKNGNVIGIVNAKHLGADNVGYAVKTNYLSNLIDSYLSSSVIPYQNSISSLYRPDQIKAIKQCVFLIECSSN